MLTDVNSNVAILEKHNRIPIGDRTERVNTRFVKYCVLEADDDDDDDDDDDIGSQLAITKIGRPHLSIEWVINNYTLLDNQGGICLKSPPFESGHEDTEWNVKLCLSDEADARIHVALIHHTDASGNSRLKKEIDGALGIFKSDQKLTVKKFDKLREIIDVHNHIYEYADESVDLLTGATPDDSVKIALEIDMPLRIVTNLSYHD
ncbi:uncharacterized protein [Fopius arisanus]|nr:PREDICTED: uncharacterized protein LOC105265963 isoform X2 [Fopius arisanus]